MEGIVKMFEFDANNSNPSNDPAKSVLDPTALTQEEVAEIIRIAEGHSLSREARYQLLLRARDRKRQAYKQLNR